MSRVTVNVDGLSLVHEDSGGVSSATLPDVCLTSPSNAPAPYANVARSRDLASGSSLVRADGNNRIALAGSNFARSTGGEPGSAGVTSGVSGREATFLSYSFDVAIEGQGACRLTDKMLHNRGNTLNCSGVQQQPVEHAKGHHEETDDRAEASREKVAIGPGKRPLPWRGVDSNVTTIDRTYALSRGFSFIGRYLISNPSNKGLTPTEAAEILASGMDLFALWEVSQLGPNNRAFETGSASLQYQAGVQDATLANIQVAWCNGKGMPIYFTVDHPVGKGFWNATMTDTVTGDPVSYGELILQYFRGIRDVLHDVARVGVYGTYWAVKELFDHNLVQYGWQQIWGSRGNQIDKRAQLLQYAIYPGQTHKRHGNHDALWPSNWFTDGLPGAGYLDLDVAVSADFGQWPRP